MWQHSMYRTLPQHSIFDLKGYAELVRHSERMELLPGYVLPAALSTCRESMVKVMAEYETRARPANSTRPHHIQSQK